MWSCAGVLALVACASAVTRDQFYPHGLGLDQALQKGGDVPSIELQLKVPITFFKEEYESVYINNYGVLTFRADISPFLNIEFPLPYPSIAAFYSNIDTTLLGAVYFRETNEPHVLSKAEESVQNNFREYYDFKPTSVLITTWEDVSYESPERPSGLRNSFQVAIISNGTESFAELLYPEIQWIQKESQLLTLPEAKAQAGFISEDGRIFQLRGSGTHQIRNIVAWSNIQEPGKYVFRIGNISPSGNIDQPDQYNQSEVEVREETNSCSLSGSHVCHLQARCVDYQAGICCQCNEGYYGNGKSCIKNDVPLRVHGKINGVLNNIHLNDVDIQAYIVVAEGKSYTALSLVPENLGSSLQLLNVLGGVIGWLFAKPSGTAKNGYQLTGALFNHTADIYFPTTGDRVTINQEYLGHDVFDQISLETDIRGSIPALYSNAKLELSEYTEQFTLLEPGLIRSDSSRKFINKITGEKYEQIVAQTITFNSCRYAPVTDENVKPLTLRVTRNYLAFENNANIVRYGMGNNIHTLGQEDPCIQGRSTCGPNSSCVAQEDSYTCVCQTGFTHVYQNDAVVCVDIDECQARTHNCDLNADCNNQDGGFQCICRSGFEGNGITCKALSSCRDKRCDVNARCEEAPNGEARCVCNQGYEGDGQWCYNDYQSVCTRCSPYSTCAFVQTGYVCTCREGFTGDGYNCVYTERRNESQPLPPVSSNEADYNDTFVLPNCDSYGCGCPPGYYDFTDERNIQLCRLGDDSNPDNNYDQSNTEPNYNPTEPQNEYPTDPTPTEPNYDNRDQYWPTAAPAPPQERPDNSYQFPVDPNYQSTTSEYDYQPPNNNYEPPPNTNYDPNYDNGNYGPPQNNYQPQPPVDNGQTTPISDNESISCSEDTDCPPNAVCSPDGPSDWDSKHCVCPEGYEGDAYECIERSGPTCTCGAYAHCFKASATDNVCVCDPGYHGDGYMCRPNFPCRNNSDCEYNAECRLDPNGNAYICQCLKGYKKDENDACIPDVQLCNGAWCVEHASCLLDSEIGVNYCQCDEGFTGDGIRQCVPAGNTCDVNNDCSLDATCAQVASSYQCVCNEGFLGDGYSCIPEATCRNDPGMCDLHASCIKRNGAYVCECNSGYNGDGNRCELNPRQTGNFLVVSDGASVYKVPFKVTARDFATPINSGISQVAVGVDVDCAAGRIYWGDVVSNAVETTAYDGSNFTMFLTDGVKSPEGISVDWSARNIFWTDSRRTIEVANMDTKARKVLFSGNLISNPRGIAVHPRRGKIFWSDWNRANPKIEWANMDGSQRGVFLDSADVKLPNSLAIDWVRERLCYADAGLTSIKCVNIDTREKETIVSNCSYPFGLAINENRFYWTDWKTLKIEYIDVLTLERGVVQIATASRRLYGVAVAPDRCPPVDSVCMFRNGGCGHNQLCLPNGNGGRSCVDGDTSFRRR